MSRPDDAARRIAATDFSRNLVVSAGAGTGKTSLLVERALNALASGVLEVPELAAITFTEKAAGEMRQRLAEGLEGLRALARGETDDDRGEAVRALDHLVATGVAATSIADRALRALQELDEAKVVTIHSFCAELLRAYPVEAGVAPDFEVDRGERALGLVEPSWAAYLSDEFGAESTRSPVWRTVLERWPLARVREAARALSGFGIPHDLLGEGYGRADLRSVLGARIDELRRRIDSILERQEGLSSAPLGFLEAARAAFAVAGSGVEAMQRACRERAELRRKPAANKRLRGVTASEYESVAGEVYSLLRALGRVDESGVEALVRVVSGFVERFRETMLERGLVSFDGLLVLARNLVRDHPEVREGLKRRYRMLLVDEFQDTDPLQYEIVLFLAEKEGGLARDPFAADLAPGRLFVVGDPKQSIYRFRGADYTAFRRAVDRIAPSPEQRLSLVSNFRGVPMVLEPVNDLFDRPSVWSESDYQPRYERIEPSRADPGDGPRVQLWTVEVPPGALAEDRRQAEGRAIASEIHRRVEQGRCRYGDVFILLRAFSPVAHYLRPLREWGIPFVVDGGRDFLERTEVVQLRAVLRSLARPSDPVAVLAYLRSPAAGVPDAELDRYARERPRWSWRDEVDRERFPAIRRAFELMRGIAEKTANRPTDEVVRAVLADTQLLPLGAFGFEGAQRVANLRKLAATAAERAWRGTLSFNEILDALDDAGSTDIEGDSPLADEATDAVRVATIHKAKGLESRVVFVPDLARQLSPQPLPEFTARVTRTTRGLPTLAIRSKEAENTAWVGSEQQSRLHERAEELRTLYVAMTRASEQLILLAGRSRGRAPWVEVLSDWGYDPENPPGDATRLAGDRVVHRLVRVERAARPAMPPAPHDRSAVDRYEEAARRFARLSRPPLSRPSRAPEERESAETAGVGRRGPGRTRGLARAVGTVVHRALESWDLRNGASLLAPLGSLAGSAAATEGVDASAVGQEASVVLEGFLGSPLEGMLRAGRIVGREIPLLFREANGTRWAGTIDLLFEREGTLVVVDFKTDRDLAEETARGLYGDQLRLYAAAVRSSLGLDAGPRAELWMLRDGSVVEVGAE